MTKQSCGGSGRACLQAEISRVDAEREQPTLKIAQDVDEVMGSWAGRSVGGGLHVLNLFTLDAASQGARDQMTIADLALTKLLFGRFLTRSDRQ